MPTREKERRRIREQFNRVGKHYALACSSRGISLSGELLWIPPLTHARVLDVGCGPGAYSRHFARHARTVVSLDLSETMLHLAAQGGASNIHLIQADALRLPLASSRFDLCFCSFCFAHFLRPRPVLREMARVLRPGGLLAIMDVVAPDAAQRRQLNRLERARESCYTRLQDMSGFRRIFRALPLRALHCSFTAQGITFRRWAAASNLRAGTAAFSRARRVFSQAVAEQAGQWTRAPASQQRYYYVAARFLFQKLAPGEPRPVRNPLWHEQPHE